MKISIITPCYNSAHTILENIESVKKQSYKNIEHIIIDGKSTDDTLKIIKDNIHPILRYISEKDNGLYDAINKGIQTSSGDIVGILNSDDFFYDEFILEKISESFTKKNIDAVYGDLVYVDKHDTQKIIRNWVSKEYTSSNFFKGWMPPHPTFYVKKEVYLKLGLYNTTFKISADYELMLRFILKHQIKTHYIPSYIVKMRVGGVSNSSFLNRIYANMEDRRAWKINGLQPKFYTLFFKPLGKILQFFLK